MFNKFMPKYIDKDKVVAEIERRIAAYRKNFDKVDINIARILTDGKIEILKDILSFLDTFEAKEVSSIWNNARKTIPEDSSNQIICIKEDDLAIATIGKLVHGTKKWAYLNDLLNISNIETKEVNLEKEFYDFLDTLIGKDNGRLSEDELFRIAEYFYELGLKAQKGGINYETN